MNLEIESSVPVSWFSIFFDGKRVSLDNCKSKSALISVPDDVEEFWFKGPGIGRSRKIKNKPLKVTTGPVRISLWKLSNFQALFVMVFFTILVIEFWPIFLLPGKIISVITLLILSGLLGNIFIVRVARQYACEG